MVKVGNVSIKTNHALYVNRTVKVSRIHRVETGERIRDYTDRNDEEVLEENVYSVFLSGKSGFQRGKTEVHNKNELQKCRIHRLSTMNFG